jgi:hypothetical protein
MTPTNATVAVFYVLLALLLFFWVGQMLNLNDIKTGGHGGENFSDVFAVILSLFVWALVAALLLMGGMKGEMPAWAVLLAVVLHPASYAAAIAAGSLMQKGEAAKTWMVVVPAVAPVLMAAYASCAFFPPLRAAIPPAAAGAAWGVVLVLAILPWPSIAERSRETSARLARMEVESQARQKTALAAARQENLAKLQALDPDAELSEWMKFTDPKLGVREEAYAAARRLKRRQSDAEEMASHGMTLPLLELPNLDLQPTPVLIQAHKDYLLVLATRIRRADAGSVRYTWISSDIDPYLPSIQWMAERHCGCSTEVAALEKELRTYQDAQGRAEALAALDKAQAVEKK